VVIFMRCLKNGSVSGANFKFIKNNDTLLGSHIHFPGIHPGEQDATVPTAATPICPKALMPRAAAGRCYIGVARS
jgi:hypothetical protein